LVNLLLALNNLFLKNSISILVLDLNEFEGIRNPILMPILYTKLHLIYQCNIILNLG
jgi:hypothetical protein